MHDRYTDSDFHRYEVSFGGVPGWEVVTRPDWYPLDALIVPGIGAPWSLWDEFTELRFRDLGPVTA